LAENSQKLPKNCMVFGKGTRRIPVILKPHADPKEMMEGMEEFMFKNCQIELTEPKDLKNLLFSAVLQKDSMPFKIFQHNLDLKVQEIVKQTGIKPIDRVNTRAEE